MELCNIVAESILLFIPLLLMPYFFILLKNIFSRNPPLPPGPFAWPIIGNLLQMGKDVHVSLANLAKVHGPLMSLRLGTQLLVVGSNAAAAREILKTHDRKLSGRFVSHSFAIGSPERNHLSLGFAKECTDQWRLLKTFSGSHLFSTKAIEAHKNVRETKVLELVSFLTVKAGENKMVDIGRAAYTTFINIMSNAIFSVDILDYEGKGSGKEIKKLFMEIIEMGGIPNLSDFYPILGGFDFQGLYKKSSEIYHKLPTFWEHIIAKRRKTRSDVSKKNDFLDALLDKQFSDEQINQLIAVYISPTPP